MILYHDSKSELGSIGDYLGATLAVVNKCVMLGVVVSHTYAHAHAAQISGLGQNLSSSHRTGYIAELFSK
jgi:hypothetical protein